MKNVNLIHRGPGIRYKREKPKKSKTAENNNKNKIKIFYVILSLLLIAFIGGAGIWAYINFLLPLKEVRLTTLIEPEKPKEKDIGPLREDEKIAKPPEVIKEEKTEKREIEKKEKVKKEKLEEIAIKKEVKEKGKLLIFSADKHYPYVLHVASFRKFANARRFMTSLVKEGYPAYFGLFNIPKKGSYYRIFIGRFETQKECLNFKSHLKSKKNMKSSYPLKLPYSLELETFNSFKSASKRDSELRTMGYSPFIFPFRIRSIEGTVKYKILIGAYSSKKDANKTSRILSKKGLKNKVIMP